jgi:hypothetical protein
VGDGLIVSREDHCARCGYLSEYHDVARRCPGMKTGRWVDRDPIDGALWPEILARDVRARMRAIEESRRPYVPEPVNPPIVCARPPRDKSEFASYHGLQAAGLGRLAAGRGMDVAPYYWKSGSGVEGCAVKGYSPGLAFVATWQRKPGKSWAVDVAYIWRPHDKRSFPSKVNHTELGEIIRGET